MLDVGLSTSFFQSVHQVALHMANLSQSDFSIRRENKPLVWYMHYDTFVVCNVLQNRKITKRLVIFVNVTFVTCTFIRTKKLGLKNFSKTGAKFYHQPVAERWSLCRQLTTSRRANHEIEKIIYDIKTSLAFQSLIILCFSTSFTFVRRSFDFWAHLHELVRLLLKMSSYSLAVNTQESQFQQNHNSFLEKVCSGSTASFNHQQTFQTGLGLKQTGFSVSHLLDLGEIPKENCTMFAAANSDSLNHQHSAHQANSGHRSPVSGAATSPNPFTQQQMHHNGGPSMNSGCDQNQRRFSGGHSDCSSPESGRKTGEKKASQ